MKKILALALTACMLLALTACGSAPAGTAPASDANAGPYVVGICQLVQHPALDAATQGFMDRLTEILGEGNVEFDSQNASGDPAVCATIANSFVAKEVDLIMANATAALTAAATATADIPILGTSVTEYGVAMDIKDFNGTVGGNVSGTSDLAPLDKQAAMIQEWFPEAKTVGLLYCSAEPNSQYQVDEVSKFLTELGYTCTLYSFTDTTDMNAVVEKAAAASDVIYLPTDNTVASNAGIIDGVCRPAGIPIIAGEEGICATCGVATLSISYYDLGVKTAEMAAKILTGEADISTMPIGYADTQTPKYNAEVCEALGITPKDGYEPIA